MGLQHFYRGRENLLLGRKRDLLDFGVFGLISQIFAKYAKFSLKTLFWMKTFIN
jgi:hypothetical protein